MSDTNDSARPNASPEAKQDLAPAPPSPPEKKAELADKDLEKVSGGTLLGSAISDVMKNYGGALSNVARRG